MYHCVVEKGLLHWDHSSIPAWEITWTEEPGRLQFMGLQESDTTEQLHFVMKRQGGDRANCEDSGS